MMDILIADDHAIFRDGLKQLINQQPDMQVAGEAADGDEVLAALQNRRWDLLILDLSMPGGNGIALIRQIRTRYPKMPILVLSMHSENQFVVQSLKAGASGYITKNSATKQLIDGIRKVRNGGVFVSGEMAEQLAQELRHSGDPLPHTTLTSREFQIFHMLVNGHKISEIARMLTLSVKTVSTHKANILQKMHSTTVADLVRYAIREHLFDEA